MFTKQRGLKWLIRLFIACGCGLVVSLIALMILGAMNDNLQDNSLGYGGRPRHVELPAAHVIAANSFKAILLGSIFGIGGGCLWLYAIFRDDIFPRQEGKLQPSLPLPLNCPFCGAAIRSDVKYQGQTVICTGCNAQVHMPLSREQHLAIANEASVRLVLAVIGGIIAVLFLIRGFLFLQLAN